MNSEMGVFFALLTLGAFMLWAVMFQVFAS
jgi:hypothetical protein